jgi:Tfp pilus assembly protein PilP
MKIGKLILAIWLAASAWAQTPPLKPQPAPQTAAKPSGGQVVGSSPKAPAPVGSGKKASAAAPQNSARRHGGRQQLAQQPSSEKTAGKRKSSGKGVRDPFVSPIVEKFHGGANCTGSGRQCLSVGEISLQGVVRYTSGYIAVVTSADHTYFLHNNDPLADGEVERITKDAITLRQRSTDMLGRPVVHEVTRKLGVPAA